MPPLVPASMNSRPCSLSRGRAADRVLEVRVAAVDDDVALGQCREQLRRWCSRPAAPAGTMTQTTRGALSRPQRSARSFAALGAHRDVRLHRVGAPVEHHHLVPALQQALHHVAAHPAQADHGELHERSPDHVGRPSSSSTPSPPAPARSRAASVKSNGLHPQRPRRLQVPLPVVDEDRRLRPRPALIASATS